jgi:hypothetical protein
MEDLAALERLAVADRPPVGVRQQVVVALTEGIVHLGEHGEQVPGTVVAEPQADRIEDEAENARKALQPDLAVGLDSFALQQLAYPGQRMRAVTGTVVGEVEAEQIPAIDREQGTAERATSESGNRQK